MQKNINNVYVTLTNTQATKINASLIHVSITNNKYLMVQDLKSVASSLVNELLSYADVLQDQFIIKPVSTNLPNDLNINSLYHVVPVVFSTLFQNFRDLGNQLNIRQTLDGRIVCSFNTLYEFWDLFGGRKLQLIQLGMVDFPVQLM